MEISEHQPGAISFVDLAASNAETQGEFYSEMMGWERLVVPGGIYTMFLSGGKAVAGMMPIAEPDKVATQWACYVTVLDAATVSGQAELQGGTVVESPFDLPGTGRVAVIADPTGAAICLYEGAADGGFRLFDEPGAACWFELMTTDASEAVAFYERIFDWKTSPMTGLPFDYWTCGLHRPPDGTDAGDPADDGRVPFAGIMQRPDGTSGQPAWQVSLSIHTDIDTFIDRATSMGASVVAGPMTTEFGSGAIMLDPEGASFGAFDRSDVADSNLR